MVLCGIARGGGPDLWLDHFGEIYPSDLSPDDGGEGQEEAERTMSSGLRFAMVTTFYPPYHFGGDAVFLRRLSHALARRGHSVDVICDVDAFRLLHPGPEPQPIQEPAGVRVHKLESRWGAASCLLTQQTGRPIVHGRRIRRLLEKDNFDVIHFHNVSLVGGPGILAYGDAIKLYTAHEHWLVCPTHVLWRHNRELCTGRECLRCSWHYRRPPQMWRYTGLLERNAKHVDTFLSPSRFSAEKHREFGFPRELEVMPYFLPDLDSGAEPPDATDGLSDGQPYFLFVGRLEKIKGLQDVIPHFGAEAPADLAVVGAGNYEAELRRQAIDFPRVRFLGRAPRSNCAPCTGKRWQSWCHRCVMKRLASSCSRPSAKVPPSSRERWAQ